MRVQGKIQIFIFKGTLMKMFQRKHIQIFTFFHYLSFWHQTFVQTSFLVFSEK